MRYLTDSGLCEDVVRVLGREMKRLAAAGVRLPFVFLAMRAEASRGGSARSTKPAAPRRALAGAIKAPYRRIIRVAGRFVQ